LLLVKEKQLAQTEILPFERKLLLVHLNELKKEMLKSPKIKKTAIAETETENTILAVTVENKPWEFSQKILSDNSWIDQENLDFKSLVVISKENIVHDSLEKYLKHILIDCLSMEPSNYKIVEAYSIQNFLSLEEFEKKYETTQNRIVSRPKLYGVQNWEDEKEKRKNVLLSLGKKLQKISHNNFSKIMKVYPVLQNIKDPSKIWKIAKNDDLNDSQIKNGIFGNGIYCTSSFDHAIKYFTKPNSDNVFPMLISWLTFSNVYPCVENPSINSVIKGRPLKFPHDVHYAMVNANRIPEEGIHDEFVISQESQLHPMFVIFVKIL